MIDFAAIDFAYPESKPENPYKVCLIIVSEGHVVQEFQSYMQLSDPLDTSIPEVIKDKCEFAPSFLSIELIIANLVSNLPIVSCNSAGVKKVFEFVHNRINVPIPYGIENIINPCEITGLSFEDSCKKFEIKTEEQTNLIDKVFDWAYLYTTMNIKGLDIQEKELE